MRIVYTTWPSTMHINKALIISSFLQNDVMPILSYCSNLLNIVGVHNWNVATINSTGMLWETG